MKNAALWIQGTVLAGVAVLFVMSGNGNWNRPFPEARASFSQCYNPAIYIPLGPEVGHRCASKIHLLNTDTHRSLSDTHDGDTNTHFVCTLWHYIHTNFSCGE